MTRVFRCYLVECAKLGRQKLPWVGLVFAAAAAALAAWFNAQTAADGQGAPLPVNGFRFFAIGVRYGLAMGVMFLMLVAGLIVASESGQGTLKMILVRPLHRHDIFGAKVLAAFAYAMVLLVVVAAVAFGVAAGCSDFADVIDPEYDDPENPYVFTTALEMWQHVKRALVLLVLPLLATAALGLAVSVTFENPGVASGTALVSFLGLEITKAFLDRREAAWYLFNTYLPTFVDNSYVAVLRGNAEGMSDAIWPEAMWQWNVWVPAVTLIVLVVTSGVVFRRKAILT